ncbi:MAG: hypothetical protein OXR68_04105 [Alphaproteobacteria bacterium]|nr:hypothetical protein [Alphaproteobacteria bacterium]MDD9919790.1 hypothetical protein [Alphaproteobacteria bacterium]
MDRIKHATAVESLPSFTSEGTRGYFTDGNPAASEGATVVPAWFMNVIQEEIMSVIEGASITPDEANNGQFWNPQPYRDYPRLCRSHSPQRLPLV